MRITPVNHIQNFKAKNIIKRTTLVPLLYLTCAELMKTNISACSQQRICTNNKNMLSEKLESVPPLIKNSAYHTEREWNNPTEYESYDEDDDQYWFPW